jgi:EmrB/QacA subfamily drug resistance transporter
MSWTKKQKSALIVVAVTSFLNPFLTSSVNLALPTIETEFGMNAVSISWIITSYLLSSAILLLPLGRWADFVGVTKIFRFGVLIFAATTLLCGFSTGGTYLIVARFLQGIGGAMTMSTGPAILVSVFDSKQRGKVLGISVSSVYLGLALGPFLGGVLTEQLSWRSIFYVSAFIGFIATVISFLYLSKEVKTDQPKRINLSGSIIYAIALVVMIMGSSSIPSTLGWTMLIAGIGLLFLFFIVESRAAFPAIDTKLFTKNKLFTFSNLAALINYSATYAIVFLISLYLQQIKGLSPQKAGFILLAQPLLMAIFSPVFGRLSDKVQPRYLATTGMSICTAGLVFFTFTNQSTPLYVIILLLVLMGFGFALFSSPNMNTIMSSVTRSQYGLASGISATMRIVGQMVSMTIVTLFFSLYFGSSQVASVSHTLFLKCMSISFWVFAAICAVGIWFSFSRGNLNRE